MRRSTHRSGGFASFWLVISAVLAFAVPLSLWYLVSQVNDQTVVNNFQSRIIGLHDTFRTMFSVRPAVGDGFCKTQITEFSTSTFLTTSLNSVEISISRMINNSGVVLFSSSQSFQRFFLTEAKIADLEVIADKRLYLGVFTYSAVSETPVQRGINTTRRKIPLLLYTTDVGGGQVEITDCQASFFNSVSQIQDFVATGCQTLGASIKDSQCAYIYSYLGSSCPGTEVLEGFNPDGTLNCISL